MSGFEMFCERCGQRYGSEEATAAGSLPLAKRFLKAVGVSSNAPRPPAEEPFLRFCLACRGYSCPNCWNEQAGFCQTCVPTEEVVLEETLPEHVLPPALEAPPMMAFETPSATEFASSTFELPLEAALPAWAPESVAEVPVADVPVVEVPWSPPVVPDMSWVTPEPVAAEPEPKPEPVVVAEPEPEPAVVAEPEPEPVVVAEPVVAGLDERPIELVFSDAHEFDEPEPEPVDWELAFAPEPSIVVLADATVVAEPEPEPVVVAEPEPEPVVVAEPEPEPVVAEPEPAPIAQPEVSLPPVFRPLPPLGPILPPPPPAPVAPLPRMEFDLPAAPPAYIIAPPQPAPMPMAARPTLPTGLFDGPGPAIRPCSQCELPVSAKARFCRRCGSAQEPVS